MPRKKQEKERQSEAGWVELPNAGDTKKTESKEIIKAMLAKERVIGDTSNASRELYEKSRFGAPMEGGKFQYSLVEALYLLEACKIEIRDKGKPLSFEGFLKKARGTEENFWIRYCVFKDFRNRGYIIKTALKFGADFRVYERGVKPGEDHAKWIVFPVHEGDRMTWYEFAAKNRVAHSTRKRLLIAIVDEESDVTYYECAWKRP